MDKRTNIAHVIVNNLGGITSLIQNLILYKDENALPQELHLLNIVGNKLSPAFLDDKIKNIAIPFTLHPKDNWYHVFNLLAKNLNINKGILISNDVYDLIMLCAFNIDRQVIQIVHDEYNLDLSVQFEDCIDVFIAHSKYIYEQLIYKLPQRSKDIKLIHYGIPLENKVIRVKNEISPLRLLFLGRHVIDKGIYDLYKINVFLKEKQINVSWTILGKGPETQNVKKQWQGQSNVSFLTPKSNNEVLDIISKNDILVFPTKFEGFPVAILESMSKGCVPIASDIVGGIQEVVIDNQTGFKCEINNNILFAEKIEKLYKDRKLLFEMQLNAIDIVSKNFDIKKQCKAYQNYFKEIAKSNKVPKHHAVNKKIGSRLDHPLIPNLLTRYTRKVTKLIS